MMQLRMYLACTRVGAAALLLLTGCNVQVSADTASLCREPEPAAGWSGRYLPAYDDPATKIRYIVDIADGQSLPPDAGRRYWVALSAMSVGRGAQPAVPARPVLYQPDAAWIVVDGRRSAATGAVRYGRPGSGHPPGEPVRALPIDLNGPELVFSALDAQRVEVAFPVAPPTPRDHWIVHLGNVQVDGTTIALPDYRSCFHPGGVETRPPWQG